jgi:hypothetical protein
VERLKFIYLVLWRRRYAQTWTAGTGRQAGRALAAASCAAWPKNFPKKTHNAPKMFKTLFKL